MDKRGGLSDAWSSRRTSSSSISCRSCSRAITRCRNDPPGATRWLLVTSYIFYGWWNPWFVLLMLFITAVNYACGRSLTRPGASERARWWSVALTVAISLGLLGFFKYWVFFQTNLNYVLGSFGQDALPVWQVVLPIGISFYVFHALSYAVDVYRGTAPVARSFADFACYIALFPQSVAGPIIRYNTVAHDLRDREHTTSRFAAGAVLFMLGFAKKVLIANPIGTIADAAFGAQALDAPAAWFGVLAYAFQIYFDFCGYSDMAVGLGRMFGFEFMKNFDSPYRAESITDFWRRWHISLSTFLRDYLYIPLGGNKRGTTRTYVNLALVMLFGGLWHGANWTFIVVGGLSRYSLDRRTLGWPQACLPAITSAAPDRHDLRARAGLVGLVSRRVAAVRACVFRRDVGWRLDKRDDRAPGGAAFRARQGRGHGDRRDLPLCTVPGTRLE